MQIGNRLFVEDVHLHQGGCTAAIDHDKCLVAGLQAKVLNDGLCNSSDGVLRAHHRDADAAAFTVLACADFHHVAFGQITEGSAVLRVSCAGNLNRDTGHVPGIALGNLGDLIQRLSGSARGARKNL